MPPELLVAWWALLGLVVGSFLNVAIHRFPLAEETIARPRRSRCPQCRHELTWRENVPVVSWVLLLGRCRWCRWRIPWRYPLVELFTGALFGVAAWLSGPTAWPLVLVQSIVLAGLIVATFVDFDCFEIPDEVSIGGMLLAPVASFAVPALHRQTWLAHELSEGAGPDRAAAVWASLAGILVGGGILLLVGWLGRLVYRRDAMGLGDVKLLAAGGGFVGPGGALAALFVGVLIASVVGVLNIARLYLLVRRRARARKTPKSAGQALRAARVAGRYLPFGPYLGIGIGIVLLGWNHVLRLFAMFGFAPDIAVFS
jgi:leader peptidase (prepilin peptidase)/N-methyltransferase